MNVRLFETTGCWCVVFIPSVPLRKGNLFSAAARFQTKIYVDIFSWRIMWRINSTMINKTRNSTWLEWQYGDQSFKVFFKKKVYVLLVLWFTGNCRCFCRCFRQTLEICNSIHVSGFLYMIPVPQIRSINGQLSTVGAHLMLTIPHLKNKSFKKKLSPSS